MDWFQNSIKLCTHFKIVYLIKRVCLKMTSIWYRPRPRFGFSIDQPNQFSCWESSLPAEFVSQLALSQISHQRTFCSAGIFRKKPDPHSVWESLRDNDEWIGRLCLMPAQAASGFPEPAKFGWAFLLFLKCEKTIHFQTWTVTNWSWCFSTW